MLEYLDDMGKTVKVSSGISGGSLQRVKSKLLPERDTKEEAQKDLDRYAAKLEWNVIAPYPGWEDEN